MIINKKYLPLSILLLNLSIALEPVKVTCKLYRINKSVVLRLLPDGLHTVIPLSRQKILQMWTSSS